jgi:hypothetical protein
LPLVATTNWGGCVGGFAVSVQPYLDSVLCDVESSGLGPVSRPKPLILNYSLLWCEHIISEDRRGTPHREPGVPGSVCRGDSAWARVVADDSSRSPRFRLEHRSAAGSLLGSLDRWARPGSSAIARSASHCAAASGSRPSMPSGKHRGTPKSGPASTRRGLPSISLRAFC